MPTWENDPALYRRRLRAELRKVREHAGLSHKQVAAEMDWSPSKLSRIEAGTVAVSTNDLRVLLGLYQVTDKTRFDELIDIARRARERSPWWHKYRDVASPELLQLCAYESSARVLRNFEPLLMPGLLQTEAYARELLGYLRGSKDQHRIDGLVALRMQRQELLNTQDERSQHFLMDEAVIRRVVGGPAVMRKQLLQLKESMHRPNITIGVIPYEHGMYRGLRVPYVVYEFDELKDGATLYLENPAGESVAAEDTELPEGDEGIPNPTIYLEIFFELEHVTNDKDTEALIDDALAALDRSARRRPQLDLREVEAATTINVQAATDPTSADGS
jgi:transcriptional regulator with XRE-family HTH domain